MRQIQQQLTARRSTAARSANHQLILLPVRSGAALRATSKNLPSDGAALKRADLSALKVTSAEGKHQRNSALQAAGDWLRCLSAEQRLALGLTRRICCALTFDMSGGPKGAKRPLERPLDGRVRHHWRQPDVARVLSSESESLRLSLSTT